jgi:hypothetical protein
MFEVGDIVRITKKWLNPHEDPNTDYIVVEVYGPSRGVNDKNIMIRNKEKKEFRYFYDFETVTEEMIYKIGHIELEGRK